MFGQGPCRCRRLSGITFQQHNPRLRLLLPLLPSSMFSIYIRYMISRVLREHSFFYISVHACTEDGMASLGLSLLFLCLLLCTHGDDEHLTVEDLGHYSKNGASIFKAPCIWSCSIPYAHSYRDTD